MARHFPIQPIHPSHRLVVATVLAVTVLATAPIAAQTWTSAANGNFELGTNWVGGVAPASTAATSLTFGDPGIASASYIATNNTANFTLNAMSFAHNAGSTVTIASAGAGSLLNFTGTTPAINSGSAGNNVITSPVNVTPAGATSVDYSVAVNMPAAGNLTFAGVLGGATTNGTGANADVGFTGSGTGTGTLVFTGGGTTGFLRLNNRNVDFNGGTYNLAATGNDTPSTAAPNPPPSSPLILAQTAGDNVTATIRGGTVINSADNIYFGNLAGSVANVTITGAGTVVNAGVGTAGAVSGRFGPGNKGTGNVTINAGAVVNSFFVFQSRLAGSVSSVLVDGNGSRLFAQTTTGVTNSGQFAIGNQSTGTMTVQNGGELRGRNFLIGQTALSAANDTGLGDGTLNVIGTGRLVAGGATDSSSAGFVQVGAAGNGRLNVTAGGQVIINNNGAATPAGGGLLVANDASINTTQTGRIDVDGAGSLIQAAGEFDTSAGNGGAGGTATVNITNGGRITIGTNAFLTPAVGGSTAITVTGTNSLLSVTGQLQLGGNGATPGGAATITIGGGGAVTSGGQTIINDTASVTINAGGTLTVGNLGNTTATNFGNITNNNVLVINGALVTTGTPPVGVIFTYAGVISGPGSVSKSGTGLQELTGANTYAGGTTVSGGALFVSNTTGSGTGTGAVNVTAGVLAGVGRITGPVTIASGAVLSGGVTDTGILTLVGATTMAGGSTLSIGITGTTPGSGAGTHDQINLGTTGAISFAGAILDASANTNALTAASQIVIIQGAANSIAAGNTFVGKPNGSQFLIPNAAGTVGTSDFYTTTINYNYSAGTVVLTGFTPVPEPTHMLLACGVVAGIGWFRRRRSPV
ncbi:MAG: autotransporter-associated beta strand repeat-containing protein [Gemmataceae bacterium]